MEDQQRYLLIDSSKRDSNAWPNANVFTLNMLNPIKSITKVDLVFAVANLATNTNVYGLLDIEQFRTIYGVSDMKATANAYNVLNNFAIVPILGSSQVIWQEASNYRWSVEFQQPIESLDRLSIRWTDKSGNPLVFGPDGNQFLLRIYTTKLPAPDELDQPVVTKEFKVTPDIILGLLVVSLIVLLAL